jgi:hypothetical protein
VSNFQPTHITLDPPPSPDPLAGAVVQGLARPIGGKLSWTLVRSLLVGLITFGVWPIFSWFRTFRMFATAEQQQYLHLARWVRENTDHPLGRRLEEDAAELTPRNGLTLLTLGGLLAAVGGVVYVIWDNRLPAFDALLSGTYGYNNARVPDWRVRHFRASQEMFGLWVFGLLAAYFFHWLQVVLHAGDVRRFVARFSQVVEADGFYKVKAESLGTTLRPLWVAAGVLMFAWGAPWGVMAMLAGAAQRRYITWTSRNTRADVAQRLRAMMIRRRPAAGVPVPVYLRERCVEPKCRAEFPRGANYCPRCGTRQKGHVNRLA